MSTIIHRMKNTMSSLKRTTEKKPTIITYKDIVIDNILHQQCMLMKYEDG